MGRSSLRHCREIYCVDSAGETPFMHGEVGNDPCPGVYNPYGFINGDGEGVTIFFNACVDINCGAALTGIQYRINGTAPDWTIVAGCQKNADNEYEFSILPDVAELGDVVEWRYVGGNDVILDCVEGNDVGDLGPIILQDDALLGGPFIAMETGGSDIILLEEDDGTGVPEGIYTEDQIV